jgi:hypothetical protein
MNLPDRSSDRNQVKPGRLNGMTRQWKAGDLSELREAAATWVAYACAAIGENPPYRSKTVITDFTDGGHKMARVPTIDLVAVCFGARDLPDHAQFEGVWRFAAAHRDVFTQVPALDDESPAKSREEQRTWASVSVGEPILRAYVERVDGFEFDRATFDEVFDAAERDLRSPTSPYVAYAPYGQLSVEGDAVELLPGVIMRAATKADRERWLNREHVGSLEHLGMLDVDAVLEAPYEEEKHQGREAFGARRAQELVERVDTAIQLALDCDAHHQFLQFERRAIFGTSTGGTVSPPPQPQRGRRRGTFAASDVEAVAQLERALATSPSQSVCAVALRRWDQVTGRGLPEDNIVDAWVGLESLLFTAGTGEITYRASLRLAALIGRDSAERRQLLKAARDDYGIRSRVVHGVRLEASALESSARRARDFLRRALSTVLLMNGVFDPEVIESDLAAAGWAQADPESGGTSA